MVIGGVADCFLGCPTIKMGVSKFYLQSLGFFDKLHSKFVYTNLTMNSFVKKCDTILSKGTHNETNLDLNTTQS